MNTECKPEQLEFQSLGRREVDQRIGLLDRLAACFTDHRNPESIEHSVRDLVAQRDLTGERRVREQDLGNPLAASSTLNRLELGTPESASSDRYKRITADSEALDRLLVDLFLESYRKPPRKVWLDLDATDDPLHGQQEGRFFHGYYRCYCYLPLYIFSGEHLLCARLRT
ncbi:transposase, partial [Thiolapillus sp.]